jgi:hypothetical protein
MHTMDRRHRIPSRADGNALVIALFMVVTAAGLAFLSLSASTSAVDHATPRSRRRS